MLPRKPHFLLAFFSHWELQEPRVDKTFQRLHNHSLTCISSHRSQGDNSEVSEFILLFSEHLQKNRFSYSQTCLPTWSLSWEMSDCQLSLKQIPDFAHVHISFSEICPILISVSPQSLLPKLWLLSCPKTRKFLTLAVQHRSFSLLSVLALKAFSEQ